MDNKENLPMKKKRSNIFKRGLSAFLALIGVASASYGIANRNEEKAVDDYNKNPYSEKDINNIDAKYDAAFDNLGIEIEETDISNKVVENNDSMDKKFVLSDIADKDIADKEVSDKDIADKESIEKKFVSNDKFMDSLKNELNDDLTDYLENDNKSSKHVEIEEKGI